MKSLEPVLKRVRVAREALILSNVKWVVTIAKGFTRAATNMEFSDLIQEGNIGLMKAVDKFDPNRGKLSTLVSWWARQGILRALSNKERQIRIPVHLIDSFNKAVRTLNREGVHVTAESVLARIDIPNMDIHRVAEIMEVMQGPVSISGSPFPEDQEGEGVQVSYEGILKDMSDSVDDRMTRAQLDILIIENIKLLPPREEKALRLFLGI